MIKIEFNFNEIMDIVSDLSHKKHLDENVCYMCDKKALGE